MDLFLNFGMAWISVALATVLTVVCVTPRVSKPINRALRKYHKELGFLLIVAGLLHGAFSSESMFSLNLGTLCWVLSVLLGLNWVFRCSFLRFKGWIRYHRMLTAAFVAVLVLHVASVGIQAPQLLAGTSRPAAQARISPEQLASGANSLQGVVLRDGTFEGEASGYRPGLKVQVEVWDNTITAIQITEHNEVDSRIYDRPMQKIPQQIIDNQSLSVDVVTGATMTSAGIVNAVRDALGDAVVSGNLPATVAQPQQVPQRVGQRGGRGR